MTTRLTRREFLEGTSAAVAVAALLRPRAASSATLQRAGSSKKIVIVGAGLAGLSAAYELTQAGHECTLLEARFRPGGRVHTVRDVFADGLYAEEGATRVPDHHDFTLKYCEKFKLALDPFVPPDKATVYYLQGERVAARPGEPIKWPADLDIKERASDLAEVRHQLLDPVLKKMGDVRSPAWPPRELARYDAMHRAELWRQLGASPGLLKVISLVEGLHEDPADASSALTSLRGEIL